MNECHFVGRLAANPVLSKHERPGREDASLAHFTLAVPRQYKKADGTPAEKVQFLDFEVWDSAAETIAKFCKKGELLVIDRASACSYPVKLEDGTKVNRVIFRVDKFNFQSTLFGRRNGKKTTDSVDGRGNVS
jgi:single-stranded DNA-binding protein